MKSSYYLCTFLGFEYYQVHLITHRPPIYNESHAMKGEEHRGEVAEPDVVLDAGIRGEAHQRQQRRASCDGEKEESIASVSDVSQPQ